MASVEANTVSDPVAYQAFLLDDPYDEQGRPVFPYFAVKEWGFKDLVEHFPVNGSRHAEVWDASTIDGQKRSQMLHDLLDKYGLTGETVPDINGESRANKFSIYEQGAVGENMFHLLFLTKLLHPDAQTKEEGIDMIKYCVYVFGQLLVNAPYQTRVHPDDPVGEYEGEVALHLAIAFQDVDMVSFLLQNGANPRARAWGAFFDKHRNCYSGEYPLSFAVSQCKGGRVRDSMKRIMLLILDAAPPKSVNNDKDRYGNAALHMAVYHDKPQVYDFLVDECGAHPGVRNFSGLTPLCMAAAEQKDSMYMHIMKKQAFLLWTYGNVQCYSMPLREIDSVQHSKLAETASVLNMVVKSGHKLTMLANEHITNMFQRKWDQFARKYFDMHLMYMIADILFFSVLVQCARYSPTDVAGWEGMGTVTLHRASQIGLGDQVRCAERLYSDSDWAEWNDSDVEFTFDNPVELTADITNADSLVISLTNSEVEVEAVEYADKEAGAGEEEEKESRRRSLLKSKAASLAGGAGGEGQWMFQQGEDEWVYNCILQENTWLYGPKRFEEPTMVALEILNLLLALVNLAITFLDLYLTMGQRINLRRLSDSLRAEVIPQISELTQVYPIPGVVLPSSPKPKPLSSLRKWITNRKVADGPELEKTSRKDSNGTPETPVGVAEAWTDSGDSGQARPHRPSIIPKAPQTQSYFWLPSKYKGVKATLVDDEYRSYMCSFPLIPGDSFTQSTYKFVRGLYKEISSVVMWNRYVLVQMVYGALRLFHFATWLVDLPQTYSWDLAIAAIFGWSSFFYFARGFRSVGPLVVMTGKMMKNDVLSFALLYGLFLFGFAQALYLLVRMEFIDGDTMLAEGMYNTIWSSIRMLMLATMGDIKYTYTSWGGPSEVSFIVKTIVMTWMVLSNIVLLNLLIALMGNTFSNVSENAVLQWRLQWARIILKIESRLPRYLQEDYRLGKKQDRKTQKQKERDTELMDDEEHFNPVDYRFVFELVTQEDGSDEVEVEEGESLSHNVSPSRSGRVREAYNYKWDGATEGASQQRFMGLGETAKLNIRKTQWKNESISHGQSRTRLADRPMFMTDYLED